MASTPARVRAAAGDRLPPGPILKYYLYVATTAAWFVMPIWTLFVLERGLTYTQVSVLNAVWWLAIVLGEVPTGYVGDRIGRRNSLLLGSAVSTVSILVFGLLDSFVGFLALYALWGIGATFTSGSESAWLYDTLAESADTGEFTRIRGRGTAARLLAMTVSALVGGYLAGVDMYLPFVATGLFMALGGAVVATIPKNRAYRAECRGPVDDRPADCPEPGTFGPRDALPVVRNTLARPPLRSFVVVVGLFYAIAWSTAMYTQPIAEDVALAHGMGRADLVPMLGWLYAGFAGVSAVVTYYADRIECAVGVRTWATAAPVVLGVAFVLAALVPVLAIPAFFLLRALLETTDVLKERFVNDHADSVGRATVLSAVGMVFGLARVPFRLLAGGLGDATSPLAAVGTMGVLLAVGVLGARLVLGPSPLAGRVDRRFPGRDRIARAVGRGGEDCPTDAPDPSPGD